MTDTVSASMKIAGAKAAEGFGVILSFEQTAAIYRAMLAASPQGEGSSGDPAPIKPSSDTGELRERVARVIGDRKGHFVSKPWGEDYELADAILDLIQSERAG